MAAAASPLSRWQEANLAAICEIGDDKLRNVVDQLGAAGLLVSRERIEALMATAIGADPGRELARFLFGVAVGFRHEEASSDGFLVTIDRGLQTLPKDDSRFLRWPSVRPFLAALLDSRSIRLAAKASDVAYDDERLFLAGRIITSVRPLFNAARNEVEGAAIVQTLRLDFTSPSGEQATMSLTLDLGDIVHLRRICDEAVQKGKVVYGQASGAWGLPTLMPGEDNP